MGILMEERVQAAPGKDVPGVWYRCCVLTPANSNSGPDQQTDRGLGFWLLLFNAMSINNKAPLICDLISEEQVNLACITETWLGPEGAGWFPFLKCAWLDIGYGTSQDPRAGEGQ